MPNAKSVRRKLTKKVIGLLGIDTVLLRVSTSETKDAYGEPEGTWDFDSFDIRIVIDTDKRDLEETPIGGLPDRKREFLCFLCKGDFDIRIGDTLVYPAGSDNKWIVDNLMPYMINNVCVITEAKAYRDSRY